MKENETKKSAKVAVVVPKNYEGYLLMLCIKNYLEEKGANLEEVTVLKTTACQLKLLQVPETVEEVYVSGLGYKNCDPKAITNFIESCGERLAFWADNHPEGAAIPELEGRNCYRHESSRRFPSCVSLLQNIWGNAVVKEGIAKAAERYENGGQNTLGQMTIQMVAAAGFMTA